MKILIAGNLGYIGASVVDQLRETHPDAELVGYDIGYFAHSLANPGYLPEVVLNQQIYGDIRKITAETLTGVDVIVNLAAISNDPMSFKFEEITFDVNCHAAVRLAKLAKENGVKSYVFASSCSMYCLADGNERREGDELNPLTAYSRSKILAEKELQPLASDNFIITCQRLATVCGWANRIRLDIVLNDFVAGALVNKEISILSNGSPWRPMIHTKDVARAIDWAVTRNSKDGGKFLAVNIGSNEGNYRIVDLANAIETVIPGTKISINPKAQSDKRSYIVNFDLFKRLAPNHQPRENLISMIHDLKDNFIKMGFNDPNYRDSDFIRLTVIDKLSNNGKLNNNLEWAY